MSSTLLHFSDWKKRGIFFFFFFFFCKNFLLFFKWNLLILFDKLDKYLNVILLAAVNLSGKIFGKHNTFYCKHYCIFCSSIFEQLLYNILLLSVLFLSFLRTWISLTTFNYKNKINRTFFLFFRKIFIFSNLLFWNLKLQYAYHYAIDIHFFFAYLLEKELKGW